METTFDSPVTGQMISQMIAPLVATGMDYEIAQRLANVLGVPLHDITWHKDTEAKMLAIFMEIVLNPLACHKQLAEKYSIYLPYMRRRLVEMGKRLKTDAALRRKVLLLNLEFFNS